MTTAINAPSLRLAWSVWGLGALFYLIGFYQRVAPAVITAELMNEFKISATTLGHLSAFYYYAYVVMQIPTGILSDIWGPRRLLTIGAFVAGIGTLMFSMAPSLLWANLGRLLVGASVGVAYVGMLKLAGNWFPSHFFAMVSGLALMFGIVGAVFAGVPLRLAVDFWGWRPVMLASAITTFAVCAAIWLIVRDEPKDNGYAGHDDMKAAPKKSSRFRVLLSIGEVFKYPNTGLLPIIPGGIVGCLLTFSGLWGVPFLTTHYDLQATEAAALASALLVAWAIGGPILGGLSDRIGRRKPLYLIGCALTLMGWSFIIYYPNLPVAWMVVLLLVVGFASGSMIIGFAFAKESVPSQLAGTVSGITNMGVMLGPTLLQPAVGWVLDQRWHGDMLAGVRIYNLDAYRAGFSLMIAWAALAFVLLFFTKETHCRQLH
jgi:MFS family permease